MFLVENLEKIQGFSRFFEIVKGKKKRDLSVEVTPNSSSPVIYFTKPKWMTEEEFEVIMSNLSVSIDLVKVKSDLKTLKKSK